MVTVQGSIQILRPVAEEETQAAKRGGVSLSAVSIYNVRQLIHATAWLAFHAALPPLRPPEESSSFPSLRPDACRRPSASVLRLSTLDPRHHHRLSVTHQVRPRLPPRSAPARSAASHLAALASPAPARPLAAGCFLADSQPPPPKAALLLATLPRVLVASTLPSPQKSGKLLLSRRGQASAPRW